MGITITVIIICAFTIYLLVTVSLLGNRVSKLEDCIQNTGLEDVVKAVSEDGIVTIDESALTDTNMAYLGTQKTDVKFFLDGLKVTGVDYDLGVIYTDKIKIFLSNTEQSMYVRAGDTVYLFGNFYSGTSYGTYIRNAVLYSVEFDDQVLHIKNEE